MVSCSAWLAESDTLPTAHSHCRRASEWRVSGWGHNLTWRTSADGSLGPKTQQYLQHCSAAHAPMGSKLSRILCLIAAYLLLAE